MALILNAWYVAAWPQEVSAEKLLSRTICALPMVFFRDAQGKASALEDRCCHREMPLSQGWMESCTVRCGYHGMWSSAMAGSGSGRAMPRARIRS